MSKHYNTFPPDHSTCKEYPWDGAKTLIAFPKEQRFTEFEKVIIDPEIENYVNIGGEKFKHKKVKELACRVIDAEHALQLAETQIQDMTAETPFVPEEFGFEVIHRPDSITEAPIRMYQSVFDSKYSMHRLLSVKGDLEHQYGWKLITKRDDNTFDEITLNLPCHRIAYAAFVALDIKVEEVGQHTKVEISSKELNAAPTHIKELAKAVLEAPIVTVDPSKEKEEMTLGERIRKTRKGLGIDQYSGEKPED